MMPRLNWMYSQVWRRLSALALLALVLLQLVQAPAASATAGINQQINFQARLLNSAGATVPDGNYNIEFKIYQDGNGCVGGGTSPCGGTLKWTEDWLNNNSQGVTVKNGYFSVQLGSINTALGSSVDFNQDTLWLSLNIGNTNGTCTPFSGCSPDTEMLPFKRLAASPYSLNSGKLGGLSSSQFVQLAQGLQTDSSAANASLAINKTGGTANILQLQRGGNDVLTIDNNGYAKFQPATTDSTSALQVKNAGQTVTVFDVDTQNTRVGIGVAAPSYTLDVAGDINTTGTIRVNGTAFSSANLSNDSNLAKLNGTQTFTGVNTFSSASNSFTGNGAGLTSLDAGNVTSGTLGDGRLSSNVALLNRNSQTFTGGNQLFKNSSNSPTAFQIQDSGGGNVLTADTSIRKATFGEGGLTLSNVPGPTNFTVTPSDTGGSLSADTYSYFVKALTPYGQTDGVIGVGSIGTSTGKNDLSWDPVVGATSYVLYRVVGSTVAPVTSMGTINVGNVTSITDDGAALNWSTTTNYSPATVANRTGNITVQTGSLLVLNGANGDSYLNVTDGDLNVTSNTGGVRVLTGNGFQVQDLNDVTQAGVLLDVTSSNITVRSSLADFNLGSGVNFTLGGTGFNIIDNTSTQTVLHVDSQNGFIGINSQASNPQYAMDVGGDVNATGVYRVGGTQIATANLGDNANIAKLGASQTFTGANTFSSSVAANGGLSTAGANINAGTGTITSGAINGQTISSAASFTGTLAFATLGTGGTGGSLCRGTGNQLATCGTNPDSVTLQQAYDASANPEVTVDSTRGALTIRDSSPALGANLLEVINNIGTVTYFGVTSSGISVTGTATVSSNINSSGGTIKTAGVDRISNGGNLLNIGTLTLSGAISGGTSYSGSGNINTTAGTLQTNSITRIANNGDATLGAISGSSLNLGSGTITSGTVNGATIASASFNGLGISSTAVTATGALNVTTTGANNLTLTSTGGTIVAAASTLQRSASGFTIDVANAGASTLTVTNSDVSNVANLSVEGSISAGTTVTAGTGITATTGNIVATVGDVTATAGGFKTGATTRIANNGDATLGAVSSASINNNNGGITNAGAINTNNANITTGTGTVNTATISGGSLSSTAVNSLGVTSTAITATAGLGVSSGGSSALTLTSASGNLLLGGSTNTIQRSNSSLTLDVLSAAGASTLTITNSDATNVANLSVEGDISAGAGKSIKIGTNDINTAGTLSNVAYLNQDQTLSGKNTFSGSGNGTSTIGILFKNTADSATALQIQSLNATVLFSADTSAKIIKIGSSAAATLSSANLIVTNVETTGTLRVGTTSGGVDISASGFTYYGAGANLSKQIVLSPEYPGAVLTTDGSSSTVGTMNSDNASSGNAWRNYYNWVSSQASLQDYTVAVRVNLPADFGSWATGSCPGSSCALEIAYATGVVSSTNNAVSFQVNNTATSPTTVICSQSAAASTSWTSYGCTSTNLATSPGWNAAGQTAIIRIKLAANSTASAAAQVGDIVLRYNAKF